MIRVMIVWYHRCVLGSSDGVDMIKCVLCVLMKFDVSSLVIDVLMNKVSAFSCIQYDFWAIHDCYSRFAYRVSGYWL